MPDPNQNMPPRLRLELEVNSLRQTVMSALEEYTGALTKQVEQQAEIICTSEYVDTLVADRVRAEVHSIINDLVRREFQYGSERRESLINRVREALAKEEIERYKSEQKI